MKAYFFNRSKNKNVLYIPKNLIVVGKKSEFEIDYKVNNIKAFDLIWDCGDTSVKRKLLGNLDLCILDELEIPNELIQRFQDYCWEETPENIVRAHLFAMEMYYIAKRSIEEFRKK